MAEIRIIEAVYSGERIAEGFISGTVTVKTEGEPEEVYIYPAKSGTPLAGWTFLSHAKCTGDETTVVIPKNLMTPEGTDSLVVTVRKDGKTSEAYTAELPEETAYIRRENAKLKFQVVSDLHVTEDDNHDHNLHFAGMLDDIIAVCPESNGIMVAGDVADNGRRAQYDKVNEMISSRPNAPDFWYVIGNHDLSGDYDAQIKQFDEFAGNETPYYDMWLGGCHFIFLVLGECGCKGHLPAEEIEWLRETIAVSASPDRPIFLFCHESVMDTVAGSMKDEDWYGILNSDEFCEILADYPQATFFTGHSHWLLSSYNEMYAADKRMCNAFNTSSVGYLWTGFNKVEGEYENGSEGLFVEVYDDIVMVRGRDFANNLWNSAAQYAVTLPGFGDTDTEETEAEAESINVSAENTAHR